MNDMNLLKKFIQHPKEVNMTYFQHFKFALNLAFSLFITSCCSTIHAFFPFLFTTFSSSKIRDLNNLLNQRYHESDK
jgi:hypothetical protein